MKHSSQMKLAKHQLTSPATVTFAAKQRYEVLSRSMPATKPGTAAMVSSMPWDGVLSLGLSLHTTTARRCFWGRYESACVHIYIYIYISMLPVHCRQVCSYTHAHLQIHKLVAPTYLSWSGADIEP